MSNYQTILLEVEDGLATLTLNRPDSMNGMTNRMVRETCEALQVVAADPTVRVLLFTGAGRAFCPGADLRWATSGARDPEDTAEPHHFRVPVLLHEMPAVTVAAVNGACAGAGFGWACGADLRVAAKSAMFNTAFLNVAVAGDMGLPWSLPRLVGAATARELSFLTEKFSADDARRMGLVARVWDDDDVFRGEVDALVKRLLGCSPTALRAMKAHYVAAERMPFGDYVDLETEHHRRIAASEDTREAFRAFLEKRPPNFKGR
jgi:2-(1,2-epoxy-1,2-dihydrophenyl)acetyl-CoA isomerase